jgi:hypothetical protein
MKCHPRVRRALASLAVVAGTLSVAAVVRAVDPPAAQYQISADTVFDKGTHLTWQRGDSPTTYDLQNAAGQNLYCGGLNIGGFSTGWRLPSKKELETLVDDAATHPSIDRAAFPTAKSTLYCTVSRWVGYSGSGVAYWAIDFNNGASTHQNAVPGIFCNVRCVHSP